MKSDGSMRNTMLFSGALLGFGCVTASAPVLLCLSAGTAGSTWGGGRRTMTGRSAAGSGCAGQRRARGAATRLVSSSRRHDLCDWLLVPRRCCRSPASCTVGRAGAVEARAAQQDCRRQRHVRSTPGFDKRCHLPHVSGTRLSDWTSLLPPARRAGTTTLPSPL